MKHFLSFHWFRKPAEDPKKNCWSTTKSGKKIHRTNGIELSLPFLFLGKELKIFRYAQQCWICSALWLPAREPSLIENFLRSLSKMLRRLVEIERDHICKVRNACMAFHRGCLLSVWPTSRIVQSKFSSTSFQSWQTD